MKSLPLLLTQSQKEGDEPTTEVSYIARDMKLVARCQTMSYATYCAVWVVMG
jgi:hypothetical protein